MVNPTPMDIGRAEYVDNPVVANMSPRDLDKLQIGYNLNFEPYASKYDNKIVVDEEGNNDLIGLVKSPRRSSNRSNPPVNPMDEDSLALKFEFQGPKRTSDERHYFKTIQDGYQEKLKSKKNSLSDLVEANKSPPRERRLRDRERRRSKE